MSDEELSQVLAAFHAASPRRVLEWGSGGSTARLLREVASIERYVSVEHDEAWAERVRREVTDPRLTVLWQPPDEPPEPWPVDRRAFKEAEKTWHELCERRREVMATYVDLPATLGETFDLALVDGRARNFCLKVAWQLVREGGVIIIHDAQRSLYHETLNSLGEPRWLVPWSQGQVCILPRAART